MKKSTKVGLVGSALYAASTFALPAFANTVEKSVEKPVLQPLDLSQITTVEQAEQVYSERIKSYTEDKKITSKEIKDLDAISGKKNYFLRSQRNNLDRKIDNLESKRYESSATGLYTEISILRDKVFELQSKRVYKAIELKGIKKDLHEKVLCYYPSLISKEKNVTYSASDAVEQELSPVVKDIMLKMDNLLKTYYKDATLELLTRKEAYTVKDVLTLYEEVYKKRDSVCFNDEEISQKQQKLRDKIQALETKKDKLELQDAKEKKIREQQIVKLKLDIEENITPQIRTSERERYPFRIRQSQKDDINYFIQRKGDLNKYMSFSFFSIAEGFLDNIDLGRKRRSFQSGNEKVVSEFKEYFQSKGYDVEVDSLKNPAKTMFPWPWWVNFWFGVGFPVFRNIIAAKFIRREVDEFDVVEGILESFLCSIFFDAAFPLFYPLRVFGMPFILEPLRAATGGRNLK